jgi:hypothetical protein
MLKINRILQILDPSKTSVADVNEIRSQQEIKVKQ